MRCESQRPALRTGTSSSSRARARRYGYQTNTRVKFVLVLALADAVVRDLDVKTVSPFLVARARELTRQSVAALPRHSQRLHCPHLKPVHLLRNGESATPGTANTVGQVCARDGRGGG